MRRTGQNKAEAEDLTQAFVERLLERRWLSRIRPEGAPFRLVLLASFQHFMRDGWQKEDAAKRGGGRVFSLDGMDAEERSGARGWSFSGPILCEARGVVSTTAGERRRGKKGTSRRVVPCGITDTPEDGFYEGVDARFGMTPGAVSMSTHRFQEGYRNIVREELTRTASTPLEAEDEVRALMGLLCCAN